VFDTNSRSFIDYLKTRQELVYGIVEADLAASTALSLGFNMQKNKGDATTNAHLPALYSDGKVTSTSMTGTPSMLHTPTSSSPRPTATTPTTASLTRFHLQPAWPISRSAAIDSPIQFKI